jgi:ethanolamine permease
MSKQSRRVLEIADYVSISAGMAIASSGYTIMSEMAGVVRGPAYLAAIALAGLVGIAISGSIAELASAYPSAPGARTYFRATLGEYPSLLATFAILMMVFLFAGVESYMLALSVQRFLPVPPYVLTLASVALIVGINLLGLQLPRLVQLIVGFVLIAGTYGLGALAMWTPASVAPAAVAAAEPLGQVLPICAAAGSALFLFTGFEWVTPLGYGPDAYRRRLPLAMPLALVLLMGMYLLFAAGVQRHLSPEALRATPTPHVALAVHLATARGAALAAGLSLLSTITTFNAGLMGASRLVYALAREGRLPRLISRVSFRTGVPWMAVLVIGIGALAGAALELAFDLQVTAALVAASLYCFVYGAFVWAGYRLRSRRPGTADGFRNPLPRPLQLALGLGLPLLGVATALSDAALRGPVCIGLLAVVLACHLLVRWSQGTGRTPASAVPVAATTTPPTEHRASHG